MRYYSAGAYQDAQLRKTRRKREAEEKERKKTGTAVKQQAGIIARMQDARRAWRCDKARYGAIMPAAAARHRPAPYKSPHRPATAPHRRLLGSCGAAADVKPSGGKGLSARADPAIWDCANRTKYLGWFDFGLMARG
jgi:hypothetical protein